MGLILLIVLVLLLASTAPAGHTAETGVIVLARISHQNDETQPLLEA
jgi:hypothetical protein